MHKLVQNFNWYFKNWAVPLPNKRKQNKYLGDPLSIYFLDCTFVCFKGRLDTQVYSSSPLCLTDVSIFAEIPKVVLSLCIIGNSVLGTKTIRQMSGAPYRKMTPHYTNAFEIPECLTDVRPTFIPRSSFVPSSLISTIGSDCSSLYQNHGHNYLWSLHPVNRPCKQGISARWWQRSWWSCNSPRSPTVFTL